MTLVCAHRKKKSSFMKTTQGKDEREKNICGEKSRGQRGVTQKDGSDGPSGIYLSKKNGYHEQNGGAWGGFKRVQASQSGVCVVQ